MPDGLLSQLYDMNLRACFVFVSIVLHEGWMSHLIACCVGRIWLDGWLAFMLAARLAGAVTGLLDVRWQCDTVRVSIAPRRHPGACCDFALA